MSALLDPLRAVDGADWSAVVTVESPGGLSAVDSLGAEVVLPTASIGKLFLLATALLDIEQDCLERDEQLGIAEEDVVADSGLLQHLDRRPVSVIDLCRFIGAVSDNLATNVLLRRVGLDRVTESTRRLGVHHCRLHDRVRDVRGPGDPPWLSTGAAGELCDVVRRLSAGAFVSPSVDAALVGLLRLNTDLSMLAAGFGLDPLAHAAEDLGIRFWNKTGTQTGVRADVGCVESGSAGERALAHYAVIARFDDSAATRHAVLDAMRAVGVELRSALTRPGT